MNFVCKVQVTDLEEFKEIINLLKYLYDRANETDKKYIKENLNIIADKLGRDNFI